MATTIKNSTADKKPAVKKAVSKKPAAKKVSDAPVVEARPVVSEAPKPAAMPVPTFEKPAALNGKYIFATGRRKTAIANIRLFEGSEDSTVNKKKLSEYFSEQNQHDTALRPLALTGLMNDYYFTAHVSGGGRSSQVEAVRHGIAQALSGMNTDLQMVLKKNGFLTRDDRKKERKKPGLRGARRAPQWAKR